MSFEQLALKTRIDEDNRMNEKANSNSIESNANIVRESSSKFKSNHKNKGKNGGGSGHNYSKDEMKDYTQQKNNNFKKVYHCWVCGKHGHKAKDFRHTKEHEKEILEEIQSSKACRVTSMKESFKLSVVTDDNVINDNNAGTSTDSVYMIDLYFLWQSRLGHDKDKQISNPRKRVLDDQLSQDQIDNASEVSQENVELRRSKRTKVTKYVGPNYVTYIVNEEPQTYKAAMKSSEASY
nr:BTB/POZ domain-containing protein NPY2 [Tanacetum cinerariifolium]GEX96555.1 BTB/POZ domain-containing protein NPY2 [Tanacetum cinerariifolium]